MGRSERRVTIGRWALVAMVLLAIGKPARAQSVESLMGADTTAGSGGEVSCGNGWALVGVTGRAGWWLNNLFLTCAYVNGGSLGNVKSVHTRIGGLASGMFTKDYAVRCPAGMVVKGLVAYRGSYIHQVGLYCRTWTASGTTSGNLYGPSGGTGGTFDARTCIDRTHAVTAIRARHGSYVDALGVRCRTP